MDKICDLDKCTGCGMCANICPKGAIKMHEGKHDFIFPVINSKLCVNCQLCEKKCPSNSVQSKETNVLSVFAGWNKDKVTRKQSSSGGVFSALANYIIERGGVVFGVVWNENIQPEHAMIDNIRDVAKLQGSKYAQSYTNDVYKKVKEKLEEERLVLFSGTPCQNSALKSFLGHNYDNLFTIDLVCHGVPSNRMLANYLSQFNKKIVQVRLRYKDPYWDYSFVRIDFKDGTKYQERFINDDYCNLFNIGFSLRESCHNCQYACTNRKSDITLADFWGYSAHNLKTTSFNYGTSCILVNSQQGERLLESIRDKLLIEPSTIGLAMRGNKCLSESFKLDSKKQNDFWIDYEAGLNVHELNEKYGARTFSLPSFLLLRRLRYKYRWIWEK